MAKKRQRSDHLAKKESRDVEFKERFDPGASQDWCETIKDIVALANSGGGVILFGVKNDGSTSGWDPVPLLGLDPAKIGDKIASYVDEQFSDFEVTDAERGGRSIAVMKVNGVRLPLVFCQPGTYQIEGGKQKTAFGKGTVYFRHGAKSEPGNTNDLRRSLEREVQSIRRSWLGNIRRVVTAPRGHRVSILPPEIVQSSAPNATPIRIVDDPNAPAYKRVDPDQAYPYRQTEVIEQVNAAIGKSRRVTSFDLLAVRVAHRVNEKAQFFYKSRFASPQYSTAFVEWIVAEYKKDADFFDRAKATMKAQQQ